MGDMTIDVNYDALDTGVFLLNAVVESLRFSDSRCCFDTRSKGRLAEGGARCMEELENAEDALATLVYKVAECLEGAGVQLQQSEQQIVNAINCLGLYSEFEPPPPAAAEPCEPGFTGNVNPNYVPDYM